MVNCPCIPNLFQQDHDGDGVGDASDDASDHDIDGDSWTGIAEAYISTFDQIACTPLGWPPDPAPQPLGNGSVQIDDISEFASPFGGGCLARGRCRHRPQLRGRLPRHPQPLLKQDRVGDGVGDACDDDIDGDGWTGIAETYIGTFDLSACTPLGWPPDPEPAPGGNGSVQIDDVTFAAAAFGSTSTPRAEIASQTGTVPIDDVSEFASRFGSSC